MSGVATMRLIEHGHVRLLPSSFRDDPHAVRYLPVLLAHPAAFDRLLALLNDGDAVRLMEHESKRGNAALRGIDGLIAADGDLAAAVNDEVDGARALAALDLVASIGTDEERLATGSQLDQALAATRAEQDRPY